MEVIQNILFLVNLYILFNLSLIIIFLIYDFLKPKSNFRINEFPNISVLIPAHNEEKVIKNTIDSILSNKYSNDIEIIVIAHNCTDSTANIVKTYSNIKLIESNIGNTKGDALNIGVKHAKHEWLCVIDSDSFIESDYFMKVAKNISETKPDACQTLVRISNKNNFITKMTDYEFLVAAFIKQYVFSKFNFAILGGNGQFIKKRVLDDVGYWSNNLADDTELTIRLLKKNYKIHFYNNVEIHQQAISSVKGFFNQRTRWCQGNTSLLPKLLTVKPFQGFNIFFSINGVLLSPIVKISNAMLIVYVISFNVNINPFYVIPYFMLLLLCCIKFKQNPLNIFKYYVYTQLMYVIYFKTFINIIRNNKTWIKTERI